MRHGHPHRQSKHRMPRQNWAATTRSPNLSATPITVDGGELLDWRADYTTLRYEPVSLPESVELALLKMTDHLGLAFAAADFVVTADNTHYFVDLNPSGQWGWIEDATALPIADAIAALLAGEDQ